MSRKPGIDELLEIMAGTREPIDCELPGGENGNGGPVTPGLLTGGGAFAWRRLMRGLAGLERDLVQSAGFPTEVERLLDGPLGVKALLEALEELKQGGTFIEADYAFALHQLRCTLTRARSATEARSGDVPKESLGHLDRWLVRLRRSFEAIRKAADPPLRSQLNLIRREVEASA
jgi:hypothetical protein